MKVFSTLAIPISLAGLCVADLCNSTYKLAITEADNTEGLIDDMSEEGMTCSLSPTYLVSALMHISVSLDDVWNLDCTFYGDHDARLLNVDPNPNTSGYPSNVCTAGKFSCDSKQAINGFTDTSTKVL